MRFVKYKIAIPNFFLVVLLMLIGCAEEKQPTSSNNFAPKVVEAKAYMVPDDSIKPPEMIPVKEINIIPARNRKEVLLESDPVLTRTVPRVQLQVVSIATPGQGIYKLPQVVPVKEHPVISSLPDIVKVSAPQVSYIGATSYSTFNAANGLSSWGRNTFQDSKGNLWLGGAHQGVDKYDGKSITRYTTAQGLIDNDINAIYEDSHGNMWFCSWFGLSKYDGKYFTNFGIEDGLPDRGLFDIIEDQKGNLWIASRSGLSKYDGKSFTNFTAEQGLGNNIDRLLEDDKGNIWMTAQGTHKASGTEGKQIIKFDGTNFIKYATTEWEQVGLTEWFDVRTNLLASTFDGSSYLKYSAIRDSELNFPGLVYTKDGSNIWLTYPSSTDSQSMQLYSYDDNQLVHMGAAPFSSDLTEDNNGKLWVVHNYGVSKINLTPFSHIQVEQGLSDNYVRSVFLSKNGGLWVGSTSGLDRINEDSITQFMPGDRERLYVTSICEDQNGYLWLALWTYGAYKFDGEFLVQYPEIGNAGIWCVMEDSKGHMWFGTEEGAVKYDGTYSYYYSLAQGLSGSKIMTIVEDKNNNIWFGSIDNGLTKYDGKEFTHFAMGSGLKDLNVRSLLEDRKGHIWVGTGSGGAFKYNGRTFTQYTVEQGLSSNTINGILEDAEGQIWFGTHNGLSRLQLAAVESGNTAKTITSSMDATLFKNYLYSDGFQGIGNWYNSLVQDNNGIIWAGSMERLTAFDPGKDRTDTIPPHIELNAVLLFNQEINWLELEKQKDTALLLKNGRTLKSFNFSTVSEWNYTPEELELAHNNNALTFKFTGISTNKPELVKYQYMLEGLDNNWGTFKTTPVATYTNLSHGKYTFKAKAMNSEGYTSKKLSYSFTIHPPWWLSWWAYIIYGIFFIAGLRIVHLYQKKRVLRLERIKSQKKELEQAKEVEKAYTSLKATQTQLIQSEKMASLGELTAGIAHEIQNPLNFVNNFSEVNNELIAEMNEELDNGDLVEAKAIADDIKQNLEKINHHGKRADGIVKGMLQHSRSSSGKKEPTDINALADEYLRLAYHGLRAKDKSFSATMETEFDDKIGKINVVPQDIGRVILNLITNAFYAVNEKSTSANLSKEASAKLEASGNARTGDKNYEPTVSVSTKKKGNQVLVSVKDNGNGIPDSVRKKIFQPFFTTKPTGQGTGLGLSMSYDIVTKGHNGKLKVESEQGKGTTFTITLPLAQKT